MKTALKSFFRKPTVIAAIASVFFMGFLFVFLKAQIRIDTQKAIKDHIISWNYELTDSLYNKNDTNMPKKILRDIKSKPISSYRLTIDKKPSLSWKDSKNVNEVCDSIVTSLSLKGGLRIGNFKACISDEQLSLATLKSNVFVICIFMVTVLVLMTSFLPLRSYKTALNRTIELLKVWRENPKNPILVELDDSISKEFITIVQQGVESQKELTLVQADFKFQKDFLRVMKQAAHDIRKPIESSMRRLNLSSNLTPEEKLELILPSFDKVLNVANDLLSKNRKNSLKINVIKKCEIVEDVRRLVENKEKIYPEIKFFFDAPKELKAFCSIDELERVLSNLIYNAIDAIGDKQNGAIEVSLKGNEENAFIEVSDNGCGIAHKDLDHLFDEGFTKGKKLGNGLGLYYSRKKVKEWGGHISVRSKIGKGTKFEIRLRRFKEKNNQNSVFKEVLA